MFITTQERDVRIITNPIKWVRIPAGRYEMERVLDPSGNGSSWLVMRATQHGMPESFWRDSTRPGWGEMRVTIEE